MLLFEPVPATVMTSSTLKPSAIQLPAPRVIVSPVAPTSLNDSVGLPLTAPIRFRSTLAPCAEECATPVSVSVWESVSTRPSSETSAMR